MNEQDSQMPLFPKGWTFLAHGEQENDIIARCPGGHIHLDYGNLTVRFHQREFLAFARMVLDAATRLGGVSPKIAADHRAVSFPSVIFSLN